MTLEDYIKESHPSIHEEYIRRTTPYYYEPGVRYHPITSGMGCGAGGSNEPFVIKDADYLKGGGMHLNIHNPDKPDHCITIESTEIHYKLKRLDDTVPPAGRPIKNSRRRLYMHHNGIDYDITQMYFRDYYTKKLQCRLWVSRSCDQPVQTNWSKRQPFFELRMYTPGKGFSLEHTYSWDSVERAQYTLKHGLTVRQFKEVVFGDANIKLHCDLFGDK